MALNTLMKSSVCLSKNAASGLPYKAWRRNASSEMQILLSLADCQPVGLAYDSPGVPPSVPGRVHEGRGKLSLSLVKVSLAR